MKEVQYLSVQTDQVFELTRINITNVDNGNFLLVFQNPIDLATTKTEVMSANCTANQMKAAIEGYYRNNKNIRSNIYVNLTWYDVNGTETTNFTESV
jgi:hypothetical protein